jgi:hypothetical protein
MDILDFFVLFHDDTLKQSVHKTVRKNKKLFFNVNYNKLCFLFSSKKMKCQEDIVVFFQINFSMHCDSIRFLSAKIYFKGAQVRDFKVNIMLFTFLNHCWVGNCRTGRKKSF